MTSNQAKFRSQIRSIQRLVWFQRGFRWVLRAFWGSALVFLVTWTLNYFFEWLPNFWVRLGLSLVVFFIFSLVSFFTRPDPGELTWRMDRRLELKEQISTAWQLAKKDGPVNPVEDGLLADANQKIPEIHLRIFQHGWGAGRDMLILILVVVALMVMLVLTFPLPEPPVIPLPGAGDGILPALGGEPSADDVFPGEVPGMPETGEGEADSDLPGDLEDIFAEMAQNLTGDEETQDLADALDQGDLDQAADALEELASQLDQLPDSVQKNLAESFTETAPKIEEAGYQGLAGEFEQSGESLDGDLDSQVEDLEDLADALRGLGDETTQAPEPTPDPVTPEPADRLEGEGQTFELDPDQASDSDLLIPAEFADEGRVEGQVPGGSVYEDEEVIDTILVPYSYPWYWQDIVSDYFTP